MGPECARHSKSVKVREQLLPCWSQDSNSGLVWLDNKPFYSLSHLTSPICLVLKQALVYSRLASGPLYSPGEGWRWVSEAPDPVKDSMSKNKVESH